MSDEQDLLGSPDPALPPPVAAQLKQVDTLATGAIALVDGGDAGHDRLYVGTGEGGAWDASMVVGPSYEFFGVGMLLSDDGGAPGSRRRGTVIGGQRVYALATDPGDREHVLAATDSGVYRRTQATAGTATPWRRGGSSWTRTRARCHRDKHHLGGDRRADALLRGGPGWRDLRLDGRRRLDTASRTAGREQPDHARDLCGAAHSALRVVRDPVTFANPKNPKAAYCTGCTGSTRRRAPRGPRSRTSQRRVRRISGTGQLRPGVSPSTPATQTTVYIGGSGKTSRVSSPRRCIGSPGRAVGRRLQLHGHLIGASSHADVHTLVHRPGTSDELWVGCDGGRLRDHERSRQRQPVVPLVQRRPGNPEPDRTRAHPRRGLVRVLRRTGQRRPALPRLRGLGPPVVRRRRRHRGRLGTRRSGAPAVSC